MTKRAYERGHTPYVAPQATPASLEAAALRYLERYAASADQLRRRLLARVDRSVHTHGGDRETGAREVDALIGRLQDSGLLDDARFAEGRAASLRRQGASRAAIRSRLTARGVAPDLIASALAAADEETRPASDPFADPDADSSAPAEGTFDPELVAARTLARRRRLGPWRPPEQRAAHRRRDLAALARAGFSAAVAVRVIDAAVADDPYSWE